MACPYCASPTGLGEKIVARASEGVKKMPEEQDNSRKDAKGQRVAKTSSLVFFAPSRLGVRCFCSCGLLSVAPIGIEESWRPGGRLAQRPSGTSPRAAYSIGQLPEQGSADRRLCGPRFLLDSTCPTCE
jgi:hypothetical protein